MNFDVITIAGLIYAAFAFGMVFFDVMVESVLHRALIAK